MRMLFNHSVGVPAFREKVPAGTVADWDATIDLIEREAPFWEPGTRNGYHMLTFGWVAGEPVRRLSGKSLGRFFADEVAGPTGAGDDFYIGLPESEEHRVAPVIFFRPDPTRPSAMTDAIKADRKSIPALALLNVGGFNPNDRLYRARGDRRWGWVRHGPGPRQDLPAACQRGRGSGRRRHPGPDGRGLRRHRMRRHPATPHPLRPRLHEVDRQPPPPRWRQGLCRSCRPQRSATWAPAVRSVSPTRPAG